MSMDAEFNMSPPNEGYVVFKEETRTERNKNKKTNSIPNDLSHILPPIDNLGLVYASLILAGIGFLLPYNTFILAADFFKLRYPQSMIIFDMSTVYILVAFFAVLLNNIMVETLSLHTRITFGYIISLLTLLFVAVCEIRFETFGDSVSYKLNIIAVGVVAFGCTVQQSSFYGFASMLPLKYTHAVMTGESIAGFIVSINRLSTKKMLEFDSQASTFVFFFVSIIILLVCFIVHRLISTSSFVQYYITLCHESHTKIILEPTEDSGLMDPLDLGNEPKEQFGFLKLQQSPTDLEMTAGFDAGNGTQYSAFSFSNPVYEPTTTGVDKRNPSGSTMGTFLGEPNNVENSNENEVNNSESIGTKYKVEDIVVNMRHNSSSMNEFNRRGRIWRGIKRGVQARWEVSKLIWREMLAIGLAYFVTLCFYPGILSGITSCQFKSWLPVILMTLFNLFDLIGKMMSSKPSKLAQMLLTFNGLRILTVVVTLLFMMTAGDNGSLDYYAMVFSIFLGVTNGIYGSVPMIVAPTKVSDKHREITGNIMTLSYNLGLTTGTIAAYFLNNLIKLGNGTSCIELASTLSSNVTATLATLVNQTDIQKTAITLLTNVTSATLLNQNVIQTPIVSTVSNIILNGIGATNGTTIFTSTTALNIPGSFEGNETQFTDD